MVVVMATESRKHTKKMSLDEVCSYVREHDDPAVTAVEIAEDFDVTPAAARYRLAQLEEKGLVDSKKVGGSARIWYAIG